MRRRLVIAKAERIDTMQLELEFKDKLAELDKLAGTIDLASTPDGDGKSDPSRPKPKGRRDLGQLKIPEERLEIPDPEMESRVARGEAERIGFEESSKMAWQRGGPRRLVVARVNRSRVCPCQRSAWLALHGPGLLRSPKGRPDALPRRRPPRTNQ
jgi:hypothetical protein